MSTISKEIYIYVSKRTKKKGKKRLLFFFISEE